MFLNNVTGLTLLILLFFGMLSFMTGIINLIPIPPTDGWHIIQAIIEKIKKKNFSYKTNVILNYFGIIIIVLLNLYIVYYSIIV